MNKKASARDVLVAGVLLFVFALAFFIAHFALNTTIDGMLATSQINASSNVTGVLNSTKSLTNRFDYVIAGLFIALALGVFITGWFIGGNPIFMIIYFIVIIVSTLLCGILSGIWKSLTQASVFGTTSAYFPITNQILNNLQIYVAVIGLIGLIVMFGKPYFEQQGGGI